MKKLIFMTAIYVGLFFISTSAIAQINTTTIDFKIKNIGVNVDGNFSKVKVTSNFNKNNLSDSFINAVVEISSINTNNKKRDAHLLKTDYFDETNYKEMKLASTKIEKISVNTYNLTAKLTIKKTTKTVVIPLIISESGGTTILNASFEVNRRNYDVGGSSWVMSDTVKIKVKHTIKNN